MAPFFRYMSYCSVIFILEIRKVYCVKLYVCSKWSTTEVTNGLTNVLVMSHWRKHNHTSIIGTERTASHLKVKNTSVEQRTNISSLFQNNKIHNPDYHFNAPERFLSHPSLNSLCSGFFCFVCLFCLSRNQHDCSYNLLHLANHKVR